MRLAAILVLCPLLTGTAACSTLNCTQIGGTNGVGVYIPAGLVAPRGTVVVEVCDETGCASTSQRLGPSKRPVGRGVDATFGELGRSFEPGAVEVRVELRDHTGAIVASTAKAATLTRSFPNGEACDGEGFVGGSIDLQVDDAGGPPVIGS